MVKFYQQFQAYPDVVCVQETKLSLKTFTRKDSSNWHRLLMREMVTDICYYTYIYLSVIYRRRFGQPCFCIAPSLAQGYQEFHSIHANAAQWGVATFVRAGQRAHGLWADRDGRILITDHGDFVLFNIYAPCKCASVLLCTSVFKSLTLPPSRTLAAVWQRTDTAAIKRRLRFIKESNLHSRVNEWREQGRSVILVGDLNISFGSASQQPRPRNQAGDDAVQGQQQELTMTDIRQLSQEWLQGFKSKCQLHDVLASLGCTGATVRGVSIRPDVHHKRA